MLLPMMLTSAMLVFSFCVTAQVVEITPPNEAVRFVSLLADAHEFNFVESCAANPVFDAYRDDGKSLVYFPVQKSDGTVAIMSLDVADPLAESEHVCDVNCGRKGAVSVYGSKLTDDGFLLVCYFNLNQIVIIDLKTRRIVNRVLDIPCPNDLCYDKNNQHTVYVAAGKKRVIANEPVSGQVIALHFTPGYQQTRLAEIVWDDLGALAGIESTENELIVSELYRIIKASIPRDGGRIDEDVIG
ncbi:hypothetical protein FJ364_00325 [Candidatus Dependentiae bacterium]|nr:hypothetical protein [Candidatus Dependentiae bacterium]